LVGKQKKKKKKKEKKRKKKHKNREEKSNNPQVLKEIIPLFGHGRSGEFLGFCCENGFFLEFPLS